MYSPVIVTSAPINPATGLIPSYSTSVEGTNSQNMGDLRIDHDFNDANRLSGVYHGSSQDTATSPVSALTRVLVSSITLASTPHSRSHIRMSSPLAS
jgi:hypothetical protein